ncbi:hypothetical protein OF83DRAFT_1288406 [Amylostereum chailletii]|nr:hypothetical protein OF83DRAFT_1288406 [Amylostereum chailletii]
MSEKDIRVYNLRAEYTTFGPEFGPPASLPPMIDPAHSPDCGIYLFGLACKDTELEEYAKAHGIEDKEDFDGLNTIESARNAAHQFGCLTGCRLYFSPTARTTEFNVIIAGYCNYKIVEEEIEEISKEKMEQVFKTIRAEMPGTRMSSEPPAWYPTEYEYATSLGNSMAVGPKLAFHLTLTPVSQLILPMFTRYASPNSSEPVYFFGIGVNMVELINHTKARGLYEGGGLNEAQDKVDMTKIAAEHLAKVAGCVLYLAHTKQRPYEFVLGCHSNYTPPNERLSKAQQRMVFGTILREMKAEREVDWCEYTEPWQKHVHKDYATGPRTDYPLIPEGDDGDISKAKKSSDKDKEGEGDGDGENMIISGEDEEGEENDAEGWDDDGDEGEGEGEAEGDWDEAEDDVEDEPGPSVEPSPVSVAL